MSDFWPTFHALQTSGTPFCTVTQIEGVGSVPGEVGGKLLVTSDALWGNIGGGKIEARAAQHARELLQRGSLPTLVAWNLQSDLAMTCGGAVKLFFEPFNTTRWPVAVFGAGHVAQALVRALLPLDCQVTCMDTRPEWIERLPAVPSLRPLLAPDLPAQVALLPASAFVVLMTMGHATDLPILRELLQRPFPYIGVIGSKNKARALRRTLLQEGYSSEDCERFYCPVGLSVGGNHPAEIAISIIAQMLQVRG